MKIIKREMNAKEEYNDKAHLPNCQASFNSDGVITLRNYGYETKNNDEIIILSKEETGAILRLFSELGVVNKNYNLPF